MNERKFKPYQLVYVTEPNRFVEAGKCRYVGETMSFETPDRTVMVRRAPGFPGTLVELPVTALELCDWNSAYVSVAEVENGARNFPVDMLRYDDCVPVNFTLEGDELGVHAKLVEGLGDKLLVARTFEKMWMARFAAFTTQRWESFGCSVKPVYYEKVL